ncbi:MAG: hypothetical protein HYR56_12360 [Acidobacteria bacterium]|nr:hypothetical protein [Acidobacteriota bacterium]MBI3423237.1 hypothetical protein [Acidobacteriota bacterium]
MIESPALFADLLLARRLEKTEGQSNADFVEARARVFPDSGATWIKVAGTYAMFDGVQSPCTQTFGLGIFEPVTPAALDEIEAFFCTRQAPVHHEVSPLAEATTFTLLNERGYQPFEFTSVMFRALERGAQLNAALNENIAVRPITEDEHDLWARIATAGWSEYTEFADMMHGLSLVTANRTGGVSFIAELAGQPIATGALCLCDGVALLAGASTIPSGRKQGAQLALLEARLRFAAEQGCDLAMMCAAPGSSSQRNAERQGFRIAYTRIKWQLPQAAA